MKSIHTQVLLLLKQINEKTEEIRGLQRQIEKLRNRCTHQKKEKKHENNQFMEPYWECPTCLLIWVGSPQAPRRF